MSEYDASNVNHQYTFHNGLEKTFSTDNFKLREDGSDAEELDEEEADDGGTPSVKVGKAAVKNSGGKKKASGGKKAGTKKGGKKK